MAWAWLVVVPLGCGAREAGPDRARVAPRRMTLSVGDGETLELARVPAGVFVMGSPDDEPGRDSDERRHRVRIRRPFYLGVYEITQGQWQAVMGDNPSGFPGHRQWPVESVTWAQAMDFCRTLSMRIERTVTLPTEAQWEHACRAGTTTPFWFGAEISLDDAHYDWTHDGALSGEQLEQPVRVGRFPPNAWGLHDMHGNVREWCLDFYARSYAGGEVVVDPRGPDTGDAHVLRGGGWDDYDRWCRSAARNGYKPDDRQSQTGFRVCVPL